MIRPEKGEADVRSTSQGHLFREPGVVLPTWLKSFHFVQKDASG